LKQKLREFEIVGEQRRDIDDIDETDLPDNIKKYEPLNYVSSFVALHL
jgi:hypothetical protein